MCIRVACVYIALYLQLMSRSTRGSERKRRVEAGLPELAEEPKQKRMTLGSEYVLN